MRWGNGLWPGAPPLHRGYPTGRGSRNDHVCGPNGTMDGEAPGQAISWLRNADSPQMTGLPQARPYTLSTQQMRRGGGAVGSGVHGTLLTGPNTHSVAEWADSDLRTVVSAVPLPGAPVPFSGGLLRPPSENSTLPTRAPSPLPISDHAPLPTGLAVSPTTRRWL